MTTRFVPAEPIPPGEIVQDEMDARGWTQEDLAAVLGMSRRQVANVVSGNSGITPDTAHGLGQAFGSEAETWMNLQVAYELALSAKSDRDVAKRALLYDLYPIREMVRREWIAKTDEADALASELCRFLRVPQADQRPEITHAARKGTSYACESGAELAWYCRARQLAEAVAVPNPYSSKRLDRALADLKQLAENCEDVRRVPATLARGGIRFVIVKHLKGTKLDGATLWLDKDSPAIAMSLRYDRIDNFWHTLIHEMDHVRHRDVSVDSDIFAADESSLPANEKRANEAAASFLVAPEALASFIARQHPLYYQHRVTAFAKRNNVHPGIVVGQLQRRRKIKWSQLRKLLEPFRTGLIGQALTDGWGNAPQV